MRLIVHAPNVHIGGGRSLLIPLLEACSRFPCPLILDERLRIRPALEARFDTIHRVPPKPIARLKAELLLRNLAGPGDVVLCMGNLPPLFSLAARTFVFVQNRYLAEDATAISGFSRRVRLRIRLEKLWLHTRKANAKHFVVQTESMRQALQAALNVQAIVMPFVAFDGDVRRRSSTVRSAQPKAYDLLYVASGEPHKNHRCLVEAWVLLAQQGWYPHLCLTLGAAADADLKGWIEQEKREHDLRITNVGELSAEAVQQLYHDSKALIFPSVLESFGLPLIEARRIDLPILASELDYVRDLVDPEETFDPNSPRSIARAVIRFLHLPQPHFAFMNAADFLDRIIEERLEDRSSL